MMTAYILLEYVVIRGWKMWTLPEACSLCEEHDVVASLLEKVSTIKGKSHYYQSRTRHVYCP